jgi:Na+-transporting NADH:ubiquinone oxidoreductase subunit D
MADAAVAQGARTAEREPLFSAKNRKAFRDPLIGDNPIATQVLGICSALAVTTQVKPSVVMGISVTFVIVMSNVIISVLRKLIPYNVRIVVEMTVIASLVILVDQVLKAYAFDVSRQLSVFVGLIITNCIIMGRLEAFAMANKPWPSLMDGLGNGLGYAAVIVIVGFFRELLGAGNIYGVQVVPQFLYDSGFVNNGLMALPPGAFFLLGLLIWVQRLIAKDAQEDG